MPEFDSSVWKRRRKRNDPLAKMVAEYAASGMKLIPAGHLHRPETLRENLGLGPSDFGVCAFMGSSPGRIPNVKEIVRGVATELSRLNETHDLHMPLISGGGNWKGDAPNEKTGLMAEWAYGATRNNNHVRFVITQGLIAKEGLPKKPGTAICLRQNAADSNDARLGLRTDGLLYAGKFFIVFPGGFGTLVELLGSLTNLGISGDFDHKKFLIVDPIATNPETTATTNFWASDIQSIKEKNQFGFVGNQTAERINDNCLLYRPDATLTPEGVTREIVAITLATRDAARTYDPRSDFAPLPPTLLREYLRPIESQSTIGRIYNNHPHTDRSWVDSMGYLSGARRSQPTDGVETLSL